MSLNILSPITNAFIVNGRYVKGPYLRDINADNVLTIMKTKTQDENGNTVDVFEVVCRSSQTIKNDLFVFLAGSSTIDDLLTFFGTTYNNNKLHKYTDLKAIDITRAIRDEPDILVNDSYVVSRVLNAQGDTDLYVNFVKAKDKKIFTVTGDQTNTEGGYGYPGPGSDS